MLRNSLIISAVIHAILLIALSFTAPAEPVSRKTPLFLELYGDTSVTETGSSGTVAVDAGKQMKQSGGVNGLDYAGGKSESNLF
jgi:hypothetical protein